MAVRKEITLVEGNDDNGFHNKEIHVELETISMMVSIGTLQWHKDYKKPDEEFIEWIYISMDEALVLSDMIRNINH